MKFSFLALCSVLPTLAFAQPKLQWEPLNEPGCGGWLTSLAVNPADSSHLLLGGDMLGIGVSRDGGMKWGGGFGLLSYEIANFTFHPKNPRVIWVGTMSGPHLSTDGGMTWSLRRKGLPPVSDNSYRTPIQQIFIDPENDQRLLAFGGSWRGWESRGETQFGWIWESLDGGETWKEFATIKRYRNIKWVAAAAGGLKTLFATVLGKGLYKSVDGGKTWAEVEGLPSKNASQVATHPTDPSVLWVAMGNTKPEGEENTQPGGIWKSTDGGASWKLSSKGLPQITSKNANFSSRYGVITVCQDKPEVLYTSDTVYDHPAIYRSDDGGASWRAIFTRETHRETGTAYPAGLGATVITADPHNPDIVYAAGSETVIKSSDGGKTWLDVTAEKVQGAADESGVQPPVRWRGRGYSGLCTLTIRFNPHKPDVSAIVSMDAGRIWISEDREKSWRNSDKGFAWEWGGGRDVAFGGPDGNIMLGAFGQHGGNGSVGLSHDGGNSWKMLGTAESGLPLTGKGEASSAHIQADDPSRMWVVYNGTLYHSADGGKKWQVQIEKGCSRITADPHNVRGFYVAGGFGVQKTKDGQTFELLADSPKPAYSIAADHQNAGVIYATKNHNNGGGVWKFDGTSWRNLLDNARVSGIAVDPTDGQRILVSTNRDPFRDECDATGAWISEDGGATWSNQRDGLPMLRGWDVAINPHDPEQVYFCSLGRGFFKATWPKKK